ncbi:hypothetical protein K470DRAFT_260259 [Piedraia hortae CBS 480.64]|uniref:Uncharacterized protein n=1 Tax=Piedraia hortae CBS 480.64 TaxID=1314780 RepID=A0A6A7BSR1_9PEZI|nr:hypothetical protein K470DRAFT_260259 [Piedraia hortae CBS 480.64]
MSTTPVKGATTPTLLSHMPASPTSNVNLLMNPESDHGEDNLKKLGGLVDSTWTPKSGWSGQRTPRNWRNSISSEKRLSNAGEQVVQSSKPGLHSTASRTWRAVSQPAAYAWGTVRRDSVVRTPQTRRDSTRRDSTRRSSQWTSPSPKATSPPLTIADLEEKFGKRKQSAAHPKPVVGSPPSNGVLTWASLEARFGGRCSVSGSGAKVGI